jgi:hypothetical protein
LAEQSWRSRKIYLKNEVKIMEKRCMEHLKQGLCKALKFYMIINQGPRAGMASILGSWATLETNLASLGQYYDMD